MYKKWVNPDGSRMVCTEKGCTSLISVAGLCGVHYHRKRKARLDADIHSFSECPTPGCHRRKIRTAALCGSCRQKRWRYGLSDERFLEMMQPENYKCSNPGCDTVTRLHLDHDHSCCDAGKFEAKDKLSCGECVRGWLCRPCNVSLGQLQENPRRIQGLLDYLQGVRR